MTCYLWTIHLEIPSPYIQFQKKTIFHHIFTLYTNKPWQYDHLILSIINVEVWLTAQNNVAKCQSAHHFTCHSSFNVVAETFRPALNPNASNWQLWIGHAGSESKQIEQTAINCSILSHFIKHKECTWANGSGCMFMWFVENTSGGIWDLPQPKLKC